MRARQTSGGQTERLGRKGGSHHGRLSRIPGTAGRIVSETRLDSLSAEGVDAARQLRWIPSGLSWRAADCLRTVISPRWRSRWAAKARPASSAIPGPLPQLSRPCPTGRPGWPWRWTRAPPGRRPRSHPRHSSGIGRGRGNRGQRPPVSGKRHRRYETTSRIGTGTVVSSEVHSHGPWGTSALPPPPPGAGLGRSRPARL